MTRDGWLTPEQLADELGKPVEWVRKHMRTGAIPSVRIGRERWFTPECRDRLVAGQLREPATDSWGRVTR